MTTALWNRRDHWWSKAARKPTRCTLGRGTDDIVEAMAQTAGRESGRPTARLTNPTKTAWTLATSVSFTANSFSAGSDLSRTAISRPIRGPDAMLVYAPLRRRKVPFAPDLMRLPLAKLIRQA
jgi:hypothetical protein